MIGAMTRPEFADLRLDWGAVKRAAELAQLFRRGDNGLLVGLAAIFEREGIRIVGAHEIAPRLAAPVGLSRRARRRRRRTSPTSRFGARLLEALSDFDAGQGAIVAAGRVLAIEAAEGTDAMLARVAGASVERPPQAQGAGRRAGEGAEAGAGSAPRHAGDRPADDRGRGESAIARRSARRRARARRRSANAARARPTPRGCSSAASRRERRRREAAADRARGRRAFGRPARLQADARAAGGGGRCRLQRRRRGGDGGGGAQEPVSDQRHRGHGDPAGARPPAEDPQAHPRDGGRGHRRPARRARHHRQPGLHPSRRPPRPQGDAGSADRRLCQPERLGMAAGAGEGDASPMSTACWASCRSSPRPMSGSAGRAASMSAIR